MSTLIKGAMSCLALPVAAALAACTPSSEEAAMRRSTAAPERVNPAAGGAGPDTGSPVAPPAPVMPPPASPSPADLPAAAAGRRTLSTAFVRVGPDGHLTVGLRDGRVLVLRDVVMGPQRYCGRIVPGTKPGARFCGGYAEVAAARPGGGPPAVEPVPAVADPIGSE